MARSEIAFLGKRSRISYLLVLSALTVGTAQQAYIINTAFANLAPFQVSSDGSGGFLGGGAISGTLFRFWPNGTSVVIKSGLRQPYGGAVPAGGQSAYLAETTGVTRISLVPSANSTQIPTAYNGDAYGLCADGFGGVYISDTFRASG
jgi:hypothetical protein